MTTNTTNILAALFIAGTLALSLGCSDDGGKKSGTSPEVTPENTCGPGQIHTPDGRCLQACVNQPGYGYDPVKNQCVPGTPYDEGDSILDTQWISLSMTIVSKSKYRDFLEKYGGLCNRYTFNWHSADCDTWDSEARVQLFTYGTNLPTLGVVTVWARSDYSYYDYPVSITGNFLPINNDTGFELRRTGYFNTPSYNAIIRVVADPGSLLDETITLKLYYEGEQFGEAQVSKNIYYAY